MDRDALNVSISTVPEKQDGKRNPFWCLSYRLLSDETISAVGARGVSAEPVSTNTRVQLTLMRPSCYHMFVPRSQNENEESVSAVDGLLLPRYRTRTKIRDAQGPRRVTHGDLACNIIEDAI